MFSKIGASTLTASREVQERLSIGAEVEGAEPAPSSPSGAGRGEPHAASVRGRFLAADTLDAMLAGDAAPVDAAPRTPRLALAKETVANLAPRAPMADGEPTGIGTTRGD